MAKRYAYRLLLGSVVAMMFALPAAVQARGAVHYSLPVPGGDPSSVAVMPRE